MYFENLKTVEEIKSHYRGLAKKYHPDLGGDTATMQRINAEYLTALKGCNGSFSVGSDGRKHKYTFDSEHETELMGKIQSVLALQLNATVALIGTWIWITGPDAMQPDGTVDTLLQSMGFKWHEEKHCYYWHPGTYRRRTKHGASFFGMAAKYGYREFDSKDKEDRGRIN